MRSNCPIGEQVLYNLLYEFCKKRTVENLPRRQRAKKVTEEMRKLIEEELNKNDEPTSSSMYCSILWCSYLVQDFTKIERLQCRATKINIF